MKKGVFITILYLFLFVTPAAFAASPTINSISQTTGTEGNPYMYTGSFWDEDPGSCSATVNYGDGSGNQALSLTGSDFSLDHTYLDNGFYTATITITDGEGLIATRSATIHISNTSPELLSFTLPSTPSALTAQSSVTGTFADLGVLDMHTAIIDWGDGSTSSASITESNGSGSMTASHTYTSAGVYPIELLLSDGDYSIVTMQKYIVKYLSTAQFLAGSLSFTALPGSYPATPGASADVTFGVSAHQKLLFPTIPLTGDFQMEATFGRFRFKSTSLSSLTVVNSLATLQGTGELQGNPGYNFTITAIDGQKLLGGGLDRIRIRITDSNNDVILDNELGEPDLLNVGSVLTSGGIVLP